MLSVTEPFALQKIFMFEVHTVIRESLEYKTETAADNLASVSLTNRSSLDKHLDPRHRMLAELRYLRDESRRKCSRLAREIVKIMGQHVDTAFLEWDTGLVRGVH